MNKNDFLDILRDYLKNDFSDYEINDILRDYEEFFLNGELEGKSEAEIIKTLGSPKTIAEELMSEMKNKTSNSNVEGEKFTIDKISNKAKAMYKTAKAKGRKVLDSNKIVNSSVPIWVTILILLFIGIIVAPVIFVGIMAVIGAGLGLIGATIAGLVAWGCSFYTLSVNLGLGIFFIFVCIAGTGILIGAWTIFLNIVKIIKLLILKVISWFKTRFMYVKVKDKKNNLNSEKNDSTEIMTIEEIAVKDKEVRENE